MEIRDDRELMAIIAKEPEKGFPKSDGEVQGSTVLAHPTTGGSSRGCSRCDTGNFRADIPVVTDFKGECSFRSWIYRIATNEALRLLSQRRNDRVPLDDSPVELNSMMADEYVDYSDLETVRLQQAILALPTKQQLAFNLRYYNELGYDEIADITGSTSENVKSNYHIAKEKIIKYMNLNN